MASLLPRQNIAQQASDIKNTFSSWDSCMAHSYCKWPAIIAIIIGSLIALTILYCISRCICCGKDLVCCCFRCCGRSRGHKYLDSAPPTAYNNQQYTSHPPPMYNTRGAPVYNGPAAFQGTATFESPAKGTGGADSLPAMPSWETAESRRVEVMDEPESHEMDHLRTGVTSPMRESTASPLPRPIPLRNQSNMSVGSGRLPAGRSPYASDANIGPYGSRTQFQGSNANLHGSRTNLNNNNNTGDYGFSRPSPELPAHPSPSSQYHNPYERDIHQNNTAFDSGRNDQYSGGYNRAPVSPAPIYPGTGGMGNYNRSPVQDMGGRDQFRSSAVQNAGSGSAGGYKAYSPIQDRYGIPSAGNTGGARPYSPYGNNPYGSRPGQNQNPSYRNI